VEARRVLGKTVHPGFYCATHPAQVVGSEFCLFHAMNSHPHDARCILRRAKLSVAPTANFAAESLLHR